jgi:hypothetical protein
MGVPVRRQALIPMPIQTPVLMLIRKPVLIRKP